MWIIYLVAAIVLSTGAGIFVSQQTDITARDVARIEEPQIRGEEANRIARHLRRLYQDDPSLFPTAPRAGRPPIVVPAALVTRSVRQGYRVPQGVRFMLQSDGTIVAVFAPVQGPRGDLIAETVNRVIERDGGNTDQYGRVEARDRSRTFADISRMDTMQQPIIGGQTGPNVLYTIGGGADAVAAAKGETINVPRAPGYDWDNGNGELDPGVGAGGGGGNTPTNPGGNAGGGNGTVPGGGSVDSGPVTGLESLEKGGGTGGSVDVDVNSYYIIGGQTVVAPGFETIQGPQANFFSLTNLDAMLSQGHLMVNTITPITFENPAAAGTRVAKEAAFDAACTRIFARLQGNFQKTMTDNSLAVQRFNEYIGKSNKDLDEDMEVLEAGVLTTAMYCMGVYTDRGAQRPVPIRANRAHPRNLSGLKLGSDSVNTWKANNDRFMSATYVPNDNYFQRPYNVQIADLKAMMADINAVYSIVQTYPAAGRP